MAKAFRLATVLRVRRLQEDMARQGLAMANRMVVACEADRDRRTAHLGAMPRSGEGLQRFEEFLIEQQKLLMAADSVGFGERKLSEAKVHAQRWREEYMVALKRVKILEKLQDRRHREALYEESRQEVKFIDDLVNTRWAARMAESTVGAAL